MVKHGSNVPKSIRTPQPLFKNRVMSSEVKQLVINKMKMCVSNGVKVGNQQYSVIVGPNSVMKLIEHNHAAVIVVCRDSDPVLHNHLTEAARIRHIPVMILPSCAQQLGQLLRVKRISCFALKLPKGDCPSTTNQDQEVVEDMRMEASIDDLRDTLLQQFNEHNSV